MFQSNQQLNTLGDDGTPGFSSYSLLYPVDSSKRSEARLLPVLVSQLLVAEALSGRGRIAALKAPEGVNEPGVSAYAIFGKGEKLTKMVILNMKPVYAGQGTAATLLLDLG